jgi:hypothetical protein
MKIKERMHGEEGHFCHGGCAGYAKGGRVSQDARDLADIAGSGMPLAADPEMLQAGLDEAKGPSKDALDLADIAASGSPLAADPAMLDAGLGEARDKSDALDLSDIASSGMPLAADPEMLEAALRALRAGGPSQDAKDLSDIAGSGMPLAADPEMLDAGLKEARGYSEGGQVESASAADEKDPSEISDELREYVEKAHKEKRESRPDEGWRIAPAEKKESIAPYKKDEEEPAEMTGYAAGGEVGDPNDLLAQLQPPGAGLIAPGIAQQPPAPAAAPMAAAPAAPSPMPRPNPAAPAPTDQDFMNKANKMLGLSGDEQAGFMKLLGDNAQKAQIGAGIAGIGDAIASGGTLGKVNPGALHTAENLIDNSTTHGIQGMQTIRENNAKAQELGDKLQARDPNSPLSKWAQKAYAGVGKKIGLDLSKASASMISDVAGKGVDALNTEYQNQLKLMGLDLQKQQLAATIANQKSEREIATAGRRSEAGKALAGRSTLQAVAGAIPGTAANAAKHTLEDEMNLGKGPTQVNSRAEYDALPAGTHYVDSYGTAKVKK